MYFFLNQCLRVANLISIFHIFALLQKRTYIFPVFLFRGNMPTHYRKRELLEIYMFSFGIMQNLRSNSRPLNNDLEKNVKNDFDAEWFKLSKNVRYLKIGHILAQHTIKMGHPNTHTLSKSQMISFNNLRHSSPCLFTSFSS